MDGVVADKEHAKGIRNAAGLVGDGSVQRDPRVALPAMPRDGLRAERARERFEEELRQGSNARYKSTRKHPATPTRLQVAAQVISRSTPVRGLRVPLNTTQVSGIWVG